MTSSFFLQRLFRAVEEERYSKAADDVPDAPEGCDDYHSAMRGKIREDGCSKQEHKTEAGVLDAGLNRDCPAVFARKLEYGTGRKTD